MKVSPLKLLRVEARLTQRELAERANKDASYISVLENSPSPNVSMRTAWDLCRALSAQLGREVTPTDLFPDGGWSHSSSHATKSA